MSDCATVMPLLPGLSVDALEDHEVDLARAHVAACAACAGQLAALARLLGDDLADEPPPPPEDVWEKIEAAIARDLVAGEVAAVDLPPVEEAPVDEADEAPEKKDVVVRPRRSSSPGGPPALEDDPFAVGPYTPLEVLSAGAMGVVFRAKHRQTGEVVALKVLHEELARSALHVRRFRQEAQALAALEHPGIVPVHAVGQAGGQHYIAMGLVAGEPLDAHVARGERWAVAKVVGAVAALARAVQHAHAHGVVHRDLKPDNVLVDEGGKVVIADFGLATQVGDRYASGGGDVTGTPHYMAPEQVRGQPVDRRADVWSLGVILYRLLTHELPFAGDSAVEVQQRVLDDEPTPPRQLDPRVEPGLEAVVLRALEKDPAHRYPSAAELAQDLERVARGERVVEAARPRPSRWTPGRRPRARRFLLGALSGVLVASGTAAWGFRVVEERAARQREAERASRLQQASADRAVGDARQALGQAERTLEAARAALEEGDPARALYEAGGARGRVDDVAGVLSSSSARDMATARLVERARALRREAELVLARAHAALGRAKDAAEVLARVVQDDPFSLPLRRELARLQAQAGDLPAARASIEAALGLAPDDPDSHLELGRIHLERGEARRAVQALTRALELDPRRADALLVRADARRRLGELAAAARDARRATDLAPGDAAAWRALGAIEHALGDLDAATEALTEADDLSPSAEALAARALVQLDAGQPDRARGDLEAALRRPGSSPRMRLALGIALEASLDDEAALAAYEAAVAAAEHDPEVRALAQARLARLELARADEVRCRLEAEDRLRERLGGAAPALDALMLEAARLQVRRVERARAAVAAALRADEGEPVVQHAAARLALADGDLAAALGALRRAEAAAARQGADLPSAMRRGPTSRALASGSEARFDPWPCLDLATQAYERGCLLGEVLLAQGAEPRESGRAFEMARRTDPTGAWAQAGVAAVDRTVGLELAAEEKLARLRGAPEACGAREAGWLRRAADDLDRRLERLWTRGAIERAARAWALVTAFDPRDARAWLRRAELARQARRWDEAVLLVQRALEVDPGFDEARLLEGELFGLDLPRERDAATGRPLHLRDLARAEAALLRARRTAPARAALARARVRLEGGAGSPVLPPDVRDDLEGLLDWQAHLAQGPRVASARLREAHEAARLLSRLAPDDAAALATTRRLEREAEEWVGSLLHAALKADLHDLDRALTLLDAAVAAAPERADAWWERGAVLLRRGQFIAGVLDLARALQLDPARLDTTLARTDSACLLVDLDRVIAELDDLLAIDGHEVPGAAPALFLRGYYRLVKVQRGRAALADVTAGADDASAALRADPGFHAARVLRALLRLEAGLLDEALDDARVVDQATTLATTCWVEAVAWARKAELAGLDADEVARRRAAALERLEAAKARGMDVATRVKTHSAFEAMRAAGLIGR